MCRADVAVAWKGAVSRAGVGGGAVVDWRVVGVGAGLGATWEAFCLPFALVLLFLALPWLAAPPFFFFEWGVFISESESIPTPKSFPIDEEGSPMPLSLAPSPSERAASSWAARGANSLPLPSSRC